MSRLPHRCATTSVLRVVILFVVMTVTATTLSTRAWGGQPSRASRPIQIGILMSDSTVAWQSILDKCKEGIIARLRHINQNEGGIDGRLLEPIVIRSPHTLADAKKNMQRALSLHPGLEAFICLGSTAMAEGMAEAVYEGRPCVSVFPCSIDPAIDELHSLFSIFLPDPAYQAEALAAYLNAAGKKRLGVLYDSRSHVQTALGTRLMERVKEYGGTVTAAVSYNESVVKGDEDYSRMLDNLRAGDPEVIAVLGFDEEIAHIIRQAPKRGVTARFFGGISWNGDAVINGSGRNLNGCFFLDFFLADEDKPEVDVFLDVMKQSGVDWPGLEAAAGWDVAGLLVKAHGAKPETPEELHAAFLEAAENEPQVTGKAFVRRNDRRILKSMSILEVDFSGHSPEMSVIAEYVPGEEDGILVFK